MTEQKLSEAPRHRAHMRSFACANSPAACLPIRVRSSQYYCFLVWGSASESALVVNLSSNTGPIGYGASGWLYDQAEDGIPTDNKYAPVDEDAEFSVLIPFRHLVVLEGLPVGAERAFAIDLVNLLQDGGPCRIIFRAGFLAGLIDDDRVGRSCRGVRTTDLSCASRRSGQNE